MKNKKALLLILSLLIFISALFFIFLTQKTVNHKLIKISAFYGLQSSLLTIAQKKGFFNQYHLDAAIDWHETSNKAIDALKKNQSNIAVISDYVFVANSFQKNDFKIISSISNSTAINLIARQDHHINNKKDLFGKKIGIPKNSILEYYLDIFLTLNLMSMNDVKIVYLEPSEIDKAIIQGNIDATLIWDNNIYKIQKELKDKIIIINSSNEQNYHMLLISHLSWLEQNPDIIDSFLKAILDAENFIHSNPEESLQLISQNFKIDSNFLRSIWNKNNFEVSLPQILLKIIDEEGKWLIGKKMADFKEPLPNYLKFLSYEFLEKIDTNRVSFYQ